MLRLLSPACTCLKPEDIACVLPPVITPQRLTILILALGCLGLGFFGYSEHAARRAAEEQLRALQQTTRPVPRQATEPSPAVVVATESPVIAPENSSPEPVAETTPTATPARGGPRGPGDWVALMESPEVQQLMNMRARGQLDERYAALFAKLRLNPEQLERLQQLLVDKQNTGRDVAAAMREQGLSTRRENADQMRALIQSSNAEIDQQIRSELGEAVYAQYQEYERTQSQRAFVERVQQRLIYSAEPLNEQQASNLVATLAQNATVESNPVRGPFGGRGGGTALTEAAIAQASTYLTAGQVKALQQLQQEQQIQAELSRRARENFANRSRSTTGTP